MDDYVRTLLPDVDWDTQRECDIKAWASLKFFTPDGSMVWYASEWDGWDTFRGLVIDNSSARMDYFKLSGLEEYRDSLGQLLSVILISIVLVCGISCVKLDIES